MKYCGTGPGSDGAEDEDELKLLLPENKEQAVKSTGSKPVIIHFIYLIISILLTNLSYFKSKKKDCISSVRLKKINFKLTFIK
jgi:hypothetical protein